MGRVAAGSLVLAVALTGAACSSTSSSSSSTAATTAGGSGSTSSIPQSAYSNYTGITKTSVTVGNVATLALGGLFKGAPTGVQAYADYVNSTGGINGRKIVVNGADDGFSGQGNKQATENALNSTFALVGNFSLDDNYGGQVLAQNPGMPDVSQVLDNATNKLPNVFSPVPLNDGWQEGPIQYFKNKFPNDLNAAGSIVAASPSAAATWAGEKYVLNKVGFKVIYDATYPELQTNFTPNVIAMKNAGVKIVFLDQMPENYASSVLKSMQQQNYHPAVILGAATYSNNLIAGAGGPSAVNGDYLEQNSTLYLGQDASDVPAVSTFLHWVQVASPGFKPDLFTFYGWLSAELFAQALKNAGNSPSRGSLLAALSKVTSFNGDHIVLTTNPAAKTVGNCYIIAKVVNGNFTRVDDPPVAPPNYGFRCDYSYVTKPGT